MVDDLDAGPTGRWWQRAPQWVHRIAAGQALLAAPGGHQRTLEGLAAAVWAVLDEPGTSEDVTARILELGPPGPASNADVAEALRLLSDSGVVEDKPTPVPP